MLYPGITTPYTAYLPDLLIKFTSNRPISNMPALRGLAVDYCMKICLQSIIYSKSLRSGYMGSAGGAYVLNSCNHGKSV